MKAQSPENSLETNSAAEPWGITLRLRLDCSSCKFQFAYS